MTRFPSKPQIKYLFFTALCVVNFWGLAVFAKNYPGLIKHISLGSLFAVLAYILSSAFFESLVVSVGLVILAVILPAKLLRDDFSNRGAVLLFLSAIYIFPFHNNVPRLSFLVVEVAVSVFIALWTTLFLIEIVLFHFILKRYPKFTSRLEDLVQRMVVLGSIYLFLDILSIGYVLLAAWS